MLRSCYPAPTVGPLVFTRVNWAGHTSDTPADAVTQGMPCIHHVQAQSFARQNSLEVWLRRVQGRGEGGGVSSAGVQGGHAQFGDAGYGGEGGASSTGVGGGARSAECRGGVSNTGVHEGAPAA